MLSLSLLGYGQTTIQAGFQQLLDQLGHDLAFVVKLDKQFATEPLFYTLIYFSPYRMRSASKVRGSPACSPDGYNAFQG